MGKIFANLLVTLIAGIFIGVFSATVASVNEPLRKLQKI
jgi:hypothetical protein